MKVYTKTGDKGQTDLAFGGRTGKNDPRIQAVGALDELKAVWDLAVLHLAIGPCPVAIRRHLEVISAYIVSDAAHWPQLPSFSENWIGLLENAIDTWDASLLPLKSWLPPPQNLGPAYLQLARAVCRRAERQVQEVNLPPLMKAYLNRLADFLFVSGRYFEQYGAKHGWKIQGQDE
jgi:cob(I)alamin adenosyltransferase